MSEMHRKLAAELITAEKFAPYGELLENKTASRRQDFFVQFATGNAPRLWVNRLAKADANPVVLDQMESHPYSAQTFVPMQGGRCLVAVALSDSEGQPDMASLRAFLTNGGQGVTYRPNVWHYEFSSLDGPNEVVVVMGYTGRNDDTVIVTFNEPVEVPLAQEGM